MAAENVEFVQPWTDVHPLFVNVSGSVGSPVGPYILHKAPLNKEQT